MSRVCNKSLIIVSPTRKNSENKKTASSDTMRLLISTASNIATRIHSSKSDYIAVPSQHWVKSDALYEKIRRGHSALPRAADPSL